MKNIHIYKSVILFAAPSDWIPSEDLHLIVVTSPK